MHTCVGVRACERERENVCEADCSMLDRAVWGYRSIQFSNLITASSQPHKVISHLRMNEGRAGRRWGGEGHEGGGGGGEATWIYRSLRLCNCK